MVQDYSDIDNDMISILSQNNPPSSIQSSLGTDILKMNDNDIVKTPDLIRESIEINLTYGYTDYL